MKKTDYTYILWDFDGTVMDSAPGIIASVKYAAEGIGIKEEDMSVLRSFIGPPLKVSFHAAYGTDEETTKRLIARYRKFYHAGAMFECNVFEGITGTLKALKEDGYKQYIATSKPGHTCEQILEKKQLLELFDGVFGATEDGRIDSKLEVLSECFRVLDIKDRSKAVLIGDTKYDAIGARQAKIDCIGVTYGTGGRKELSENGAKEIFDSAFALAAYFTDLPVSDV